MKKIEYNQNDLSHVPKSIIYWVSQGVVIDGVRYAVKEFRVEEDKFKLVVEKNGEFFEVDASTNSGGSTTIDPETLKGYLKTSDLGSGQGIDVRKLDSGVVVGLTDENKRKLDTLNDYFFSGYFLMGNLTNEGDHTPFSVQEVLTGSNTVNVNLYAKNHEGKTLESVLKGDNIRNIAATKAWILGDDDSKTDITVDRYGTLFIRPTKTFAVGQLLQIMFDTN